MKKKIILKRAIVLLIAAALFFSTVAVTADTIKDQSKEPSKSKQVSILNQKNPRPIGYVDSLSERSEEGVIVDILTEGFEGGVMPPAGWTLEQNNPYSTWIIDNSHPYSGTYHASCYWDSNYQQQNEHLVTPDLDFTNYTEIYLEFVWAMSYYWAVEADTYDFSVALVHDYGFNVLFREEDYGFFEDYQYCYTWLDLSPFNHHSKLNLHFTYYGLDGDAIFLDEIHLYGVLAPKPPTAPDTNGPQQGFPGIEYIFTFHSDDPNEDKVRYHINWGDVTDEVTDWSQACTPVPVGHIYNAKQTYTITAFAEDETGLFSPPSSFTIVIPRTKTINYPILNWLQSRPNLFPLLQKLIRQLGFGL